ncbi:hypothetical protein Scep_030755 [Stephania cephalantha]|uniref:Subtilisin-like protease n=1 Tax=Stephania cephalantha TaxID=152367 RepID=A0AAP0HEL8_9MAGN
MKPSVFSTVDQWYASTLRTVRSKSPGDHQNEKDDGDDQLLIHVYRTVLHGFSTTLTKAQAEQVRTRPEVLTVYPDQIRQLQTTRSRQFLGILNPLDKNNNNNSLIGILQASDYGSNVIIGVLDTGIWPERDSFHDRGLGSAPSHWKSPCDKELNTSIAFCNNKILGAKVFGNGFFAMKNEAKPLEGETPRDTEGHGTHTASTAAGREVKKASLFGYASGTAVGIAPKARLAIYKICWANGCSDSDIIAGFDTAVQDGVDIISLSVGSAPQEYSSDPIAIAAFGAIDHGVFVSASAGNSGPSGSSVINIAPWITTVGAGTIDRKFPADLVLENGRVVTGSSLYSGDPLPTNKLFPLVYAGNGSNAGSGAAICDSGSLDPKHVRGKIVVCDRGGVSRAEKGYNVRKAGGVGMVVANTDGEGESLLNDAHLLPALSITATSGHVVAKYLAKSKNPRGTIVFRGTELDVKPAPVVAGFSSRGPNAISPYIIKPDLIAPGVDILAAWPGKLGPTDLASDKRKTAFNILSGTSMSCPHVSGVAALLKGAHQDWSPARIRSAMMTTAYVRDNSGNSLSDGFYVNTISDVWGYGSGHVDPEKAVDPGLVFDLTVDDYVQFLCGSGYSKNDIRTVTRRDVKCKKKGLKPWDLNYPSISVVFHQSNRTNLEVAVTRTVTHVSKEASRYTVSIENPSGIVVSVDPSELAFSQTEEKLSYVVNISVENHEVPRGVNKSVLGRITWSDGRHVVGVPIAVTWDN